MQTRRVSTRWCCGAAMSFTAALAGCVAAQRADEPQVSTIVAAQPEFSLNDFAWGQFEAINRQALPSKAGHPDPTRATLDSYNCNSPVVWETWAEVQEAFPLDRVQRDWDALSRCADKAAFQSTESECAASHIECFMKGSNQDADSKPDFEIRLNRIAYEYIGTAGLHHRENLSAIFANTKPNSPSMAIDFPDGAQIVKANWGSFPNRDAKSFHWRTSGGDSRVLLLCGLHVVTKHGDRWVWTSFVHNSFEQTGVSRPNPVVGSKWSNYKLLGTQVAYVDSTARPTELWNERIERKPSSCMTCHAYACITATGAEEKFPRPHAFIPGVPRIDHFWFLDANGTPVTPRFVQTDFVFTVTTASRPRP